MAKEREYFIDGMTDEAGNVVIDGAVRRGVPRAVAEKIFDEMSAFASYAFNKSHAAAYAMVAVQTAWLKRHYPVPFMAATLNSMMDNADKVAGYIQYCRQNGIPVLKPDVNKSVWRFSVDTDENGTPGIRFGLGGIKNVGHGAVELIEKGTRSRGFRQHLRFCRTGQRGDAQQAHRGKPHQGGRIRRAGPQPCTAAQRVRASDG